MYFEALRFLDTISRKTTSTMEEDADLNDKNKNTEDTEQEIFEKENACYKSEKDSLGRDPTKKRMNLFKSLKLLLKKEANQVKAMRIECS